MTARFVFIIFALLFMAGGTWHGYSTGKFIFDRPPRPSVSIFTPKNFLPAEVVSQFEDSREVEIKITTYDSAEEFRDIFVNQHVSYDLIAIDSELAAELIQAKLLKKLEKGHLKNIENIDRDFRFAPYDPNCEYTIPILWGLRKTQNSPTLYFQTMAQPQGRESTKFAMSFFNYLLEAKTAQDLSRLTKLAGTNRGLETPEIPLALRPSYLRQFPLGKLRMPAQKDFFDSYRADVR